MSQAQGRGDSPGRKPKVEQGEEPDDLQRQKDHVTRDPRAPVSMVLMLVGLVALTVALVVAALLALG